MAWANGRYRGFVVRQPPLNSFTLILRLDLKDDDSAQSGRVSLDLYRGVSSSESDPDEAGLLFLGSFRSNRLDRRPGEPEYDFDLLGLGPNAGSLNLKLRGGNSPDDPERRILLGSSGEPLIPAGPLQFQVASLGAPLRRLRLEIDSEAGIPHLRGPEISATSPIVSNRQLTFDQCMRDAGILVSPFGESSRIEPPQSQSEWTVDNLKAIALKPGKANSLFGQGTFLRVYLMLVGRLQGASNRLTTGAMFDKSERRAAAVFYGSLEAAFGRRSAQEVMNNYIFTAVHEVAHCLNLPHAFEARALEGVSSSAATFTNYPQNYSMGGLSSPEDRYSAFWREFRFEFHPQELLELRHGARSDILTGTNVSEYRGEFAASRAPLTVGGSSGAGMELTLHVRSDNRPGSIRTGRLASDPSILPGAIFEFGEPIHVEAKLRSYLQKPQPVDRRLSPTTGDLEIYYETPSGGYETYESPFHLCCLPETMVLDANQHAPEPQAFYKDVCLNFGDSSIRFLAPGRYRIRASYRYGDSILISNILDIFVRHPDRDVEDLIIPLLDSEVAAYFAYRGIHGLPEAKLRLESAFEEPKSHLPAAENHPLRRYYFAREARLRVDGVVERDPESGMIRQKEKTGSHWRDFAQALHFSDLKDLRNPAKPLFQGLPYSNIDLGRILSKFSESLIQNEEYDYANALVDDAKAAFQARGVPAWILKNCLPPKSPKRKKSSSRSSSRSSSKKPKRTRGQSPSSDDQDQSGGENESPSN